MAVPNQYKFRITAFVKTQAQQDEIDDHTAQKLKWKDGYQSFKGAIRTHLKLQQRKRCAFCRGRISTGQFYANLEHIVGKTKYPQFQFHDSNLVYCCTRCNFAKGQSIILANPVAIPANQTFPNTTGGFKIINPYFDNYEDHIDFLDDIIIVVANDSSKGRETIKTYGLTRVDLAEDRATELRLSTETIEQKLLHRLIEPNLAQDISDRILEIIQELPNWVVGD